MEKMKIWEWVSNNLVTPSIDYILSRKVARNSSDQAQTTQPVLLTTGCGGTNPQQPKIIMREVRDSSTGSFLAGAVAYVYRYPTVEPVDTAISDENGSLTIEVLPQDTVVVALSAYSSKVYFAEHVVDGGTDELAPAC